MSAGEGSIAADALTVVHWGYQLNGGRVLPPALTQAMTTPGQGETGGIGYGLGTMIFPGIGKPDLAVGHTGAVSLAGPHGSEDGYSTMLVTLPALHLSLAVLSPSPDLKLDATVDHLLAAALA